MPKHSTKSDAPVTLPVNPSVLERKLRDLRQRRLIERLYNQQTKPPSPDIIHPDLSSGPRAQLKQMRQLMANTVALAATERIYFDPTPYEAARRISRLTPGLGCYSLAGETTARVGVLLCGWQPDSFEAILQHLETTQRQRRDFIPIIVTTHTDLRGIRRRHWPYEFFGSQPLDGEDWDLFLRERFAFMAWKWRLQGWVDWSPRNNKPQKIAALVWSSGQ